MDLLHRLDPSPHLSVGRAGGLYRRTQLSTLEERGHLGTLLQMRPLARGIRRASVLTGNQAAECAHTHRHEEADDQLSSSAGDLIVVTVPFPSTSGDTRGYATLW